MAAIELFDKTLSAINTVLEDENRKRRSSHSLGMSSVGDPCERKLFYNFRNCSEDSFSLVGIKAAKDGYIQEDEMADKLKMLPYIELHNRDPKNPDGQIAYRILLGHCSGKLDGMILGILEAPGTWHVWEHKSKKEAEFNKLKKLRSELGEKKALKEWNIIYYAQGQIYMHCTGKTRHYMTVTTPGGRDDISIRTEYSQTYAESIILKAKRIIFDNQHLPSKLHDKKEFFGCKWCQHIEVCHDTAFPLVHCKTCRYREPVKDSENLCHFSDKIIDKNHLNIGCDKHVYSPALIQAKFIEHQSDCVIYQLPNKSYFANCYAAGMPELKDDYPDLIIKTSKDLREKIKSIKNLNDQKVMNIQGIDDGPGTAGTIMKEGATKPWDTPGMFGGERIE